MTLALCWILIGAAGQTSAARAALPNGPIDPSFGHRGWVATGAAADNYGNVGDAAMAPDGTLLVTGYGNDEGNINDFITRLRANGSPDNRFGARGQGASGAGSADLEFNPHAVLGLADGRVVVGGSRFGANGSDEPPPQFALHFLRSNGRSDESVGPNGTVELSPPGSELGGVGALARTATGAVVAAGGVTIAGRLMVMVARLTPDGRLDRAFGANGTVVVGSPAGTFDSYAEAVIARPDGSLLVIGSAVEEMTKRPLVLFTRLGADGRPAGTFTYPVSVTGCRGQCGPTDYGVGKSAGVQRTPMGERLVIAVGDDRSDLPPYRRYLLANRQRLVVLRVTLDGERDAGFGQGGVREIDLGTAAVANRVAVNSDQSITVAGSASDQFAMARLNAGGSLDRTFGAGGRSCSASPKGDPPWTAQGLIALPNRAAVIAGWAPGDGRYPAGAGDQTAVVTRLRGAFAQRVTCFDFGFVGGYDRARVNVVVGARVRLALLVYRDADKFRRLKLFPLGAHGRGVLRRDLDFRIGGRRLRTGCYLAALVEIDRRGRVVRRFASKFFERSREIAACSAGGDRANP